MGTKIGNHKYEYEKGYIYYVNKEGYLVKQPTRWNKNGTQHTYTEEKIEKKSGHGYYLKDGYVHECVLNRNGKPKGAKSKRRRKKK